jgi:lipopolysaccharide/colanic/teichoic acid biosynthesis glycosyltransferase/GT2 family glycosyltransferase
MISIVVPAYNAERTLPECLRALRQQTVAPSGYEILVVDDGSDDGTSEVARAAGVTVIRQSHQGAAAARNAGAAAAQGEIVLFTDADCAPSHDWIEQMSAPFADPHVVGAKGVYRTRQREPIARFVQIEYEDKYDRMRGLSSIDFVDTYSAGYRRDVVLLNGGFDVSLRAIEDQEFSFRLARKGYQLVFVPEARVYHLHNATLAQYAKRKFRIAFWKALMLRWNPEKIVSDSHTPQVMKAQIGFIALAAAALPIVAVAPVVGAALETAAVLAFLFSALPFTMKALGKDRAVGFLSPFYLWVRAASLGAGLAVGFVSRGSSAAAQRAVLTLGQRVLKRTIDVILAGGLLLLALPVWVVIAALIKLDSRGPILFVQRRVGENGRLFDCYKFRTMVAGAEAIRVNRLGEGPIGASQLKLRNDPRRTRVGRWLRRTSLDETPQFLNVLRGEMSMIGPRPEEVAIVERYNDWHRKRLAVKPGISGPTQINGRGALSLDERVTLEIDYIEHYSLGKDLVMIAKTIPAVISSEGSY